MKVKKQKPQCKKPPTSGVRKSKRYLNKPKVALFLRGRLRRKDLCRFVQSISIPKDIVLSEKCPEHNPIDYWFRRHEDNFVNNLLNPLKQKYDIELFVVLGTPEENKFEHKAYVKDTDFKFLTFNKEWTRKWADEDLNYFKEKYKPKIIEEKGMDQGFQMDRCADIALEQWDLGNKFDHYLICRLDMLWKKPITSWDWKKQNDLVMPAWALKWPPGYSGGIPDQLNDQFHILHTHQKNKDVLERFKQMAGRINWCNSIVEIKKLKLKFDVALDNECYVPQTYHYKSGACNPIFALSGQNYYYEDFWHDSLFKVDPKNWHKMPIEWAKKRLLAGENIWGNDTQYKKELISLNKNK